MYYFSLFKNELQWCCRRTAINTDTLLFKRKSWIGFSSFACCLSLFGDFILRPRCLSPKRLILYSVNSPWPECWLNTASLSQPQQTLNDGSFVIRICPLSWHSAVVWWWWDSVWQTVMHKNKPWMGIYLFSMSFLVFAAFWSIARIAFL